jgi:hypothetical protein
MERQCSLITLPEALRISDCWRYFTGSGERNAFAPSPNLAEFPLCSVGLKGNSERVHGVACDKR